MLRKIVFFILFLSSFWVSAQNEQLAMDYFEKGEFQKALTLFDEISTKQPSNYFYFQTGYILISLVRNIFQIHSSERFIERTANRLTNF